MAKVVVSTGQASCPHEGVAPLNALPARSEFLIDNMTVLTISSTGPLTFAGCINPANAGGPCSQIVSWTGPSTIFEVAKKPVILDTSVPVTDKAPTLGSVKAAGQDKFEADR